LLVPKVLDRGIADPKGKSIEKVRKYNMNGEKNKGNG
jgi:hypothetical protein